MPMLDVLIVAHGQPSAPAQAEGALATLCQEVGRHAPELSFGTATLAAPGSLDAQLAKLKPGAPIYPLFMSNGWFVKTNLANRLGAADVQAMTPFGMDSALPDLVAKALLLEPDLVVGPLLLVAHGSANGRTAPAQATDAFAARLSVALNDHPVQVGFIEQDPHITTVARRAPSAPLCLPFFAMQGAHVRDDVCNALQQAGFGGKLLPAVSHLTGVPRHIAKVISTFVRESRPLPKAACI